MERRRFLRGAAPLLPAAPLALAGTAASPMSSTEAAQVANLAQATGRAPFEAVAGIEELRAADPASAPVVFLMGYRRSGDGGGGLFGWREGEAAADNGGTIVASRKRASGRWLRLLGSGMVSVKWFGAAGDGRTDDTGAIKAALAASEGPVFVPVGRYRITESLVVRNSGSGLVGEGAAAEIEMADGANRPILQIGADGGRANYVHRVRLESLTLSYQGDQPASQTNAIGLYINAVSGWSQIRDVLIRRCYGGLHNNQSGALRTNFFSTMIDTLSIRRFSGFGIDYKPMKSGDSGSVWNNIYINNARKEGPGRCEYFMRITKFGSCSINQLNVEHGIFTGGTAVNFGQMRGTVVNSFHIEKVEMSHEGPGCSLVRFSDSQNNMRLQGVYITRLSVPAKIGPGAALFEASVAGVRANVANLHAQKTTLEKSDFALLRTRSSATHETFVDFEQIEIDFEDKLSSLVSGAVDGRPVVRGYNGAEFYSRRGDASMEAGAGQSLPGQVMTLHANALPTGGLFDRGSLVLKTDGTAVGGQVGWVAREGGGAHGGDWVRGTDYGPNAWVRGSDGRVYRSLVGGNRDNDPLAATQWELMAESAVTWEAIVTHVQGGEPPASGRWEAGAVVWNGRPSAGGHAGWICVAAGEPGQWRPFGSIA